MAGQSGYDVSSTCCTGNSSTIALALLDNFANRRKRLIKTRKK
jgi:hypothetical protein